MVWHSDIDNNQAVYKAASRAARAQYINSLKSSAAAIGNILSQRALAPLSKNDLLRAHELAHKLALSSAGFNLDALARAASDAEKSLSGLIAMVPDNKNLDDRFYDELEKKLITLKQSCLATFTLEIEDDVQENKTDASPATARDVLIIDDDQELAGLLSLNLEKRGIHAAMAADGEIAMKRMAKQKPDLVMLDISLPGINGHEVLRRLKQNPLYINTPVLMLTAHSERADVIKALYLGAMDYIVKPFDPSAISAKVEKILKSISTGDLSVRPPMRLSLEDSH